MQIYIWALDESLNTAYILFYLLFLVKVSKTRNNKIIYHIWRFNLKQHEKSETVYFSSLAPHHLRTIRYVFSI